MTNGLTAFTDPNFLWVLFGASLLAISGALVGSFVYLKKQSLMGDALSHASLPGVMMAFLLSGTKDPWLILLGATASSLLGYVLIQWLIQHTVVKQDSALAMILSLFFGIGLLLLSIIQTLPIPNKSGLTHILFGQAAAILPQDLQLLIAITCVIVLSIWLLFHTLRLSIFDPVSATLQGIPVKRLNFLIAFLVVLLVVVGMQMVGVILMAAVILIPYISAKFWSNHLPHLMLIASALALLSAWISTSISWFYPHSPSGPWMVVVMSGLFVLSFLLAPAHGLASKWWFQRRFRQRILQENLTRSLYKLHERHPHTPGFSLEQVATYSNQPYRTLQRYLKQLDQLGWVQQQLGLYQLTETGVAKAMNLTRKHRLWENYLINQLNLTETEVHQQAELAEHLLDDAEMLYLEQQLKQANASTQQDPHGKPIPKQLLPKGGFNE